MKGSLFSPAFWKIAPLTLMWLLVADATIAQNAETCETRPAAVQTEVEAFIEGKCYENANWPSTPIHLTGVIVDKTANTPNATPVRAGVFSFALSADHDPIVETNVVS